MPEKLERKLKRKAKKRGLSKKRTAAYVYGTPISVTAETVVQAAPDNFWTLLGKLVSVGGWALLLVVLVPMLFSWLMPGPVQFKRKKA